MTSLLFLELKLATRP